MANPISRTPNAGMIDAIFNVITRPSASPTQTLGAHGTQVLGGYVTVNEKNPKLIGHQRYLTYSDMLANVSIVGAGMRLYLNLVSNAGWTFDAADKEDFSEAEKTLAAEYADKCQDMADDMEQPWHRVIRRAAGYRFHGFALQEWTAKQREDGLIGMLDVAARPQVTIQQWEVDKVGTVQGVIQRSPQTQEEIPIPRGKLVYMLDDALSDSPEGLGLFRHMVEPAERLQYFQFLEACSFETNLRGIPIVKAPLGEFDDDDETSVADKQSKLQPFIDFILKKSKGKEQGLVIDSAVYEDTGDAQRPSGQSKWDVSLLDGADDGMTQVAAAIERLNREIARIMGVEMLLLGGATGTQALSRDKSLNFSLIVDSSLTEIAETFRRDWIRPIFILNGWDEKLMPKLKPDQQTRNVEEVTNALLDFAQAGATLDVDDPVVNWLRDRLGLPRQLPIEDREVDDETGGDGDPGGGGGDGDRNPDPKSDVDPDDDQGGAE